jgi:hypothetical protein
MESILMDEKCQLLGLGWEECSSVDSGQWIDFSFSSFFDRRNSLAEKSDPESRICNAPSATGQTAEALITSRSTVNQCMPKFPIHTSIARPTAEP